MCAFSGGRPPRLDEGMLRTNIEDVSGWLIGTQTGQHRPQLAVCHSATALATSVRSCSTCIRPSATATSAWARWMRVGINPDRHATTVRAAGRRYPPRASTVSVEAE